MTIKQVDYKINQEAAKNSLNKYTTEKLPDLNMRYEKVSLVYSEKDHILGRIVCRIHWDNLSIELFFVSKDARGKGVGSKLLDSVEKIALEKDCRYISLETMSFNAPVFYQKQGYHIFAQIENSPIEGETRYFMKKELS